MRRNLFAFTQPTSELPGYVSLNQEPDGRVTMAVRAQGQQNPTELELPPDVADGLCAALAKLALNRHGES
jgi:hypothetical protein